jgi:hypothetical protein
MVRSPTSLCQVQTGFFKCKEQPVGICQYCGRAFCARHADLLEDGQEVCSRKFCVAKRQDLAKHLAYKDVVVARNETRQCGIEGCDRGVQGQCSRCKGFFCGRHVDSREETVLEGQVRVSQMATLCKHCWARRPIWVRM